MSRSFALGQQLETFIDQQIECGHYDNASEVVQAGLHLLESQERLRQLRTEEIRQLIDEGRRSGKRLPATKVFDRLEARIKSEAGRKTT